MFDTREGVAPSSTTSSPIVDLTGRRKKRIRVPHARRPAKAASASSTIYIFPARRVIATRHDAPGKPTEADHGSRRFPRWLRSLTAWHGLIAGAIACYVLILCNLIYGVTSMAQFKVWRPLQSATISEFQRRALAARAECEQRQRIAGGTAATAPIASVLCSADKTFTEALDELFPRGALVREPRTSRVH